MVNLDTNFIIYGGGEVGNRCFQALNDKGYYVKFAIDKNKSGKHIIKGIYTYKLNNAPKDEESVVIICLADGMSHKAVADNIYQHGYKYILFLPMEYCITDYKKQELTRFYNYVLDADNAMVGKTILPYNEYLTPDLNINSSIILENKREMTVWCSIEILFSECDKLWQGDKSKRNIKSEYDDKNIASNHPYKSLFEFYDMKIDTYDEYFDCSNEEKGIEAKKMELKKREKLFRLFKREYNKGITFFIEGAPPAIWNPKNYWNLVGGHHRTLFLLYQGHSLLPIKVKKEDFEKWCNEEAYIDLISYLQTNKIKELYAPLPHPGFLNFPSKYEDIGKTALEKIIGFFSNENIFQMTVLDCLDDEGYFARCMERMGVLRSVFRNEREYQLQLAKLCNKLLYRDGVVVEKGLFNKEEDTFDIVFSKETEKVTLEKICKKYLIVETDDISKKKSFEEDTIFNKYYCLFQEYRDGHIREIGVYTKKENY